MRSYHEQDYYELLELTPDATQEEIAAAYSRLKSVFAESSSATFMLFGPDEAASMREMLEAAYSTLSDFASRVAYDSRLGIKRARPLVQTESTSSTSPMTLAAPAQEQEQFGQQPAAQFERQPQTIPEPAVAEVVAVKPEPADTGGDTAQRHPEWPRMVEGPPADLLSESMEYGGQVLTRLRENRGITIEAIAQRTKITMTHLRAIEANQYDRLPARVYVRGFVTQYARFLGLPSDRVAESYLQIYDRFFQNRT